MEFSFSFKVTALNKTKHLINSCDYAILSLDELNEKLIMRKKEIVAKHQEKYPIWLATDIRWKTKVPDSTKESGTKIIAKTEHSDLLEAIVEWYEKERTPDTLENLYKEWIIYKSRETTPANANKLSWVWKTYYEGDPITQRNIKELKVIDVKMWLIDQLGKQSLSRRKYKEMKSVMNMMLDFAVEKEITSRNVARDVRNISKVHFAPDAKKDITEQIFINDEEDTLLELCLSQFEKTGNTAYLGVGMNTALGLRVGEIAALKICDFHDHYVHIGRQEIKEYSEEDGKFIRRGYQIVEYTKTESGVRDIPLTSISKRFFKMIVETNQSRGHKQDFLLLDKKGKRLKNDSINNVLRRLNRKLETSQKGNHCIRKTCLSNLNESRLLTDKEVQLFAGHKDIATTQKYYIFPTQSLDSRLDVYKEAMSSRKKCNQV